MQKTPSFPSASDEVALQFKVLTLEMVGNMAKPSQVKVPNAKQITDPDYTFACNNQ